tara:strand:+ start:88 stop:1086 length:999 start_codon:yes stop_codon:yes gene_type:complete
MSLFTDQKYLNILSSQLPLFKKKGDHLWNFRCPVCGDSQKNKTKSRGYVYRKQNNLFFKCHNCGDGRSISNLIKFLNTDLHKQYVMEVYKDSQNRYTQPKEKPKYEFKRPTFKKKKQVKLPTIKSLSNDHYAKKYILGRRLPEKFHSLIYYAENFSEWVKIYDHNYKGDSDPRIVIPFFDKSGNLIAAQGRAFNNTKLRYITIKVEKDSQKIYGLDRVNLNKHVYVVEGPFDSMFLDNCIAMAGSDISDLSYVKDKVIVYDNEPRNIEIVKKMEKTIQNHIPLCIWPSGLNYKDINDIIISGIDKDKLQSIIDENTYTGPVATLKLNMWKKI